MSESSSFENNPLSNEFNDHIPWSYSRSLKIKFNKIRYSKKDTSPYLSGDSFANLSDYIVYGIKRNEKLNLTKLRDANSIFVPGNLLIKFLDEGFGDVHAKVLITGNSDQNFPKRLPLPKSINHWYCQNNAVLNSRMIKTLPIGLENSRLGRFKPSGFNQENFIDVIMDQILVPPMSMTNTIRIFAVKEALKFPKVFQVELKMFSEKDYSNLTNKYRFILCCEGNGYDSHRVWETLYRGSFPVLLNSKWAQSLKYLNLPILIIDSFEEVNQKILTKFANKHIDFEPVKTDCLWTPFWKELIDHRKNH